MTENLIEVHDWGVIDYGEALALQRSRLTNLIAGKEGDALIICQHPAVISAGTSARETSFISSNEILQSRNIPRFEVERGGDVTYHGPGQLVAYPILNLNRYKRDIGWYMRSLEQVIIDTLSNFSVRSFRIDGRAGVWISPNRKIAAMGVKLSRWRTMHGVSINLSLESELGFSHIVPCGLNGVLATSVERESGKNPELELFKRTFIRHFQLKFVPVFMPD